MSSYSLAISKRQTVLLNPRAIAAVVAIFFPTQDVGDMDATSFAATVRVLVIKQTFAPEINCGEENDQK